MLKLSKLLIVVISITAGFLVSVIAFFLIFQLLKIKIPDCSPHQADGQCGLTTFLNVLYAFASSAILWLLSSTLITWLWLRRRAKFLAPVANSL
jgi:hypothetical protein